MFPPRTPFFLQERRASCAESNRRNLPVPPRPPPQPRETHFGDRGGRHRTSHASSNGVSPTTTSQRKPSAHSGVVVSQSNALTIRSRAAASRTELKIGSAS